MIQQPQTLQHTKFGRPIGHGRTSECTDPEVNRSKVKVKFFFNVCMDSMADVDTAAKRYSEG